MRISDVFYKGKKAGTLIQNEQGKFSFQYTEQWINLHKIPLSLTFPIQKEPFFSDFLFPFFFHLLPEGRNKKLICRNLKIDETDDFGLLLHTANNDSIGAIKIIRNEDIR